MNREIVRALALAAGDHLGLGLCPDEVIEAHDQPLEQRAAVVTLHQPDGNVDYPTTTINDQTEEITFTTAIVSSSSSPRSVAEMQFTACLVEP